MLFKGGHAMHGFVLMMAHTCPFGLPCVNCPVSDADAKGKPYMAPGVAQIRQTHVFLLLPVSCAHGKEIG